MEGLAALEVAIGEFVRRLRIVPSDDWTRPTPCSEWDVRALVNHVIGGNLRYAMMLHGAATADVEATRSVDHAGDDAVGAFLATAAALTGAFEEPGAPQRICHHVHGDRTGAQLLDMRVMDLTVHAWDLARALGGDETLDPELVNFALGAEELIEASRRHGAFAARSETARGVTTSPQARLLRLVGR